MAKSTKKNASGQQKPAKASGQKPAKVGKLDKSAKADKPAKAKKETASGQQKPRGQYAVGKLRVTKEGREATLRGGRGVRLDTVRKLDGKPMSEVLGAAYRLDGEKEDRTINSGNIAVFIDKGLIEIV